LTYTASAQPGHALSVRISAPSSALDADGALTPTALAGYLQDVAARHATALGCGTEALHPRGLTWVLARQRVESEGAIGEGELDIATWPSGVERLFVHREFTVSRGGREVARASTAWLVLDLEKRRPVRPDEVLDRALRPRLPQVAPLAPGLPRPDADATARRFTVEPRDIDLNRHVNNARYIGWALDATDPAHRVAWRLAAFEVHYLAEALLGDAITVRTGPPADGAAEDALVHAILREADGKELARIGTWWVRR
jgi:acyl-ACP thioesterase